MVEGILSVLTPQVRGCADEKQKFDELVEDQGVRILIEPTAIMHVLGTKMDFVEDRLKCVLPPDAPC